MATADAAATKVVAMAKNFILAAGVSRRRPGDVVFRQEKMFEMLREDYFRRKLSNLYLFGKIA
jgi:hypothetical protein